MMGARLSNNWKQYCKDKTFYKDAQGIIINDDCLNTLKNLPNKSIDLVITDPPYSTPTVTAFGRKKTLNLSDLSIQEFYFRAVRDEFERILKPNGRVFIFCDDKYYPILFGVFYEWQNKNLVVWDKERIGMGNPFRKQHELIFYINRETYQYRKSGNITHYPTIMKCKNESDKLHGAQKPIELVKNLILGFSDEGEVICDPFLGSGTVALAGGQLNRRYIGIELNYKYCEIAKKRLEALDK